MSEQQISIGFFSSKTGLSVRALRLYDEVGLLKPATVTRHNHYRYYQLEQIKIAKQIKFYREHELSLEDIKIILEKPCQTQHTLQCHLERLRLEVEKRQALIKQLEQLLCPDTQQLLCPDTQQLLCPDHQSFGDKNS